MILINIINTIHKHLKLGLNGGFIIKLKIIILISALTCIFVSGCSTPAKEKVKSLDDAYFYIIDKKEDMKIDDVKKLLKGYSLESDLVEDEPEDDLNMYSYKFSNDNNESIAVTNTVQYNKEYISEIHYFIGSLKDYPYLSISSLSEDPGVFIDYYTNDKTTYEKAYNLINKLK